MSGIFLNVYLIKTIEENVQNDMSIFFSDINIQLLLITKKSIRIKQTLE